MGTVKLCDPQLICWVHQCHSASNVVCHLAKVISSMCREWIQNFEIQALSRVQDQCEKERWDILFHWFVLLQTALNKLADSEKYKT